VTFCLEGCRIYSINVCTCAKRTDAAARESVRQDRPGGFTSPAFHASGSAVACNFLDSRACLSCQQLCLHFDYNNRRGAVLQLDDAILDEHSYLFFGNVSKALYGKYDVTLSDFVDKILLEVVTQDGVEHDSDADTDSDEDGLCVL
jgi:hypothetical protein